MQTPGKVVIGVGVIGPPGTTAAILGGSIFDSNEGEAVVLVLRVQFPDRCVAPVICRPADAAFAPTPLGRAIEHKEEADSEENAPAEDFYGFEP